MYSCKIEIYSMRRCVNDKDIISANLDLKTVWKVKKPIDATLLHFGMMKVIDTLTSLCKASFEQDESRCYSSFSFNEVDPNTMILYLTQVAKGLGAKMTEGECFTFRDFCKKFKVAARVDVADKEIGKRTFDFYAPNGKHERVECEDSPDAAKDVQSLDDYLYSTMQSPTH